MITPEQRQKISYAIENKINPIELVLLPHVIQTKCILNAKTNSCKERLVLTAVMAAYEDQRWANKRANKLANTPIKKYKIHHL